MFYVPVRNQHLIRSTLPTSHGFVPRGGAAVRLANPLPTIGNKSAYVHNFEFVGTVDNTNYFVIPDAIKWREEVCGGEKAIIEHNTKLAREGGALIAKILGTEVMDNSTHTLTNCCLVNIRLPLIASPSKISGVNTVDPVHSATATQWMRKKLIEEHNTFILIYFFQNHWWARLSGQVYLDMSDFEWAGQKLKEICERVGKENFEKAKL